MDNSNSATLMKMAYIREILWTLQLKLFKRKQIETTPVKKITELPFDPTVNDECCL